MKHRIRRWLVLVSALAVAGVAVGQPVNAQGPVSAQALVEKLQAAGLEATAPRGMVGYDYGKAPVLCRGVRFWLPSYGEDAGGRAFYCARKGDREKLARYYVDLGRRDPEQYTHVFVHAPFILTIDGIVSDEAAAKYEAVLKDGKAVPTGAAGTMADTAPGFRLEIQKAGYEQWGRPEIMDNPNFRGRCRGDDSRPVLKLGISLGIYNTGRVPWPMGTRTMQFFKTDGTPAAWCWYDYMDDRAWPPTDPGNAWVASYTVFVEKGERVGYGIFKVQGVGEVRFDIPQNLQMP